MFLLSEKVEKKVYFTLIYDLLWLDIEQGARFGSRKLLTDLIEHKIDQIAQITAKITHWKKIF